MTTVAPVGFEPYPISVNLSPADGDFIATIRTKDGSNFPTGTVVKLRLGTTPTVTDWVATVTGSTASWNVDKAVVAALYTVVAGQIITARIIYTDSNGVDLVWFSGGVNWSV